MTITRPKPVPVQLDGFIAGAPDSMSVSVRPGQLKTKRGKARSQVSVVLPDVLLADLDTVAAKRFTSRSALITQVLRDFLHRESVADV